MTALGALTVLILLLWGLVALSSSQEYPSSGTTDQFVCSDGVVIDGQWICDGSNECPDGSDELDCATICDIHEFRCSNGRDCVPHWRVCNNHNDCPDNSDESLGCTPLPSEGNCSSSQFTCTNGQCIWPAYQCDDYDDCGDNSDEEDCATPTIPTCTSRQYRCETDLCIPLLYRCDGETDCLGEDLPSSDEMDCGNTESYCGDSFFNCSNARCINIHNYCNGINDCGDESDEENCPPIKCPRNKFLCTISDVPTCIKESWVCDNTSDCDNAEDEVNCKNCPATHFRCTSSGDCIHDDRRCNGVHDCDDASDEYICPLPPPPLTCQGNQFPCLDGQGCLELENVCDNIDHCLDDSDENDFCSSNSTSCDIDNGGCQHNCQSLPNSMTFCTCRHGYQLNQTDLKSCHDVDECAHPDSCSQLCDNTEGSFVCSCVEGYRLTASGHCRGSDPDARILFANRIDIRSMAIDGTRIHLLAKNLQYAVTVDYHYELGYVYWAELHGDMIMRATLMDGSNVTTIVNSTQGAPAGLAVDWVNNKLYWTDVDRGLIEVSELDGRHRKLLFSSNLSKPRAIVLDPLTRYMFWTDWGEHAKIERASMDGLSRTTLHSLHITWPNALTIDLPTQTIYWADAKLHVIESSNYWGANRRPILTVGVLHPFGMSLFEDRLYWSDWNTLSIFSTGKEVSRNLSLIEDGVSAQENQLIQNQTSVLSNLFSPMDLQVVHPLLQPSYPGGNPCGANGDGNGSCHYLCLLSAVNEKGYVCACPTGTVLYGDQNCRTPNEFLVYTRNTEIHIVSLDVAEVSDIALPLANLTGAFAVDLDPVAETIYWTDVFRDKISSAKIDGSNQTTLVSTNLNTPAGVAIDWLSRKLYWSNDALTQDAIEVSELNGTNRMILVRAGVKRPRDVVVHPTAGFLFWADWGPDPLIGRINLDGTNKTIIVDTGLSLPSGLALDFELEHLYWCDARTDVIEYVDFDGSNRIRVLEGLSHPYGLSLHKEQIFWTDWQLSSILTAHKLTGERKHVYLDDIPNVRNLQIFLRSRGMQHNVSHPCSVNNGGCSHLCLSRPSASVPGQLEASCKCPAGRTVMEDNRTCYSDIHQYLLFPTDTNVYQISLDTDVLAHVPLPIYDFKTASSVDVDIFQDMVYWANKLEGKIYRAPLKGGHRTVVISLDLIAPEAVVIDGIGRNIYWADSGTGLIEVADLNGVTRKVLVKGGLIQVTSLALDLQTSTLYWVDTGDHSGDHSGGSARIEMAAMDGTGRATIVTESLHLPRSIAVDHPLGEPGGRIYWTEEYYGKIESASLDGSDRQTVAVLTGTCPYGIAVDSRHIYWTDATDRSVYMAAKDNATKITKLLTGKDTLGLLALVRKDLSDYKYLPLFNHSCQPERNCSHLCLPNWSSEGYRCSCPTGRELASNTTCRKLPKSFLLVSYVNKMLRVPLSDPDQGVQSTVKGDIQLSVAMDHIFFSPGHGKLFFSDIDRGVISSMNLDGTDQADILDVQECPGLAIDWVDHLIYWVDGLHKRIEVARLDGTGRKVLVQQQVTDQPRSIAVHPKAGLMFWTDWGNHPAIWRARMDGSRMTAIINNNIDWPNGVAVDYNTNTVYWVDAGLDILQSSDVNGLDQKTLIANTRTMFGFVLEHPFDVEVKGGHLYWSEWQTESVYRADVPGSRDEDQPAQNLVKIVTGDDILYGITVVDTEAPRRGELSERDSMSSCGSRNGGCTDVHLCIPINPNQRLCACPDSTLPTSSCREYEGRRGQPPPPVIIDNPETTTTSDRSTTAATTVLDNTTTPDRDTPTSTGSTTATSVNVVVEGAVSKQHEDAKPDQYKDNATIITLALILIAIIVIGAAVFIIVGVVIFMKRENRRKKSRTKQFNNPTYISINSNEYKKKDFSTLTSRSSFNSKSEGSLLPKLNNAKVFQDTASQQHSRQEREKKTNSNIFVEEPDKYIIPGGKPVQHVPHMLAPDEIPLKEIPMETPSQTPSADGESDQLLPPPPIPPKTYIKMFEETECLPKQPTSDVCDSVEAGTKVCGVVVQVEHNPNIPERGKGVRFHSNVKFPNEEEPPPLPTRDHVESCTEVADGDTVTVDAVTEGTVPMDAVPMDASGPISATSDKDTTQSRSGGKIAAADVNDGPEEGELEIAIVNKDGVVVGEMVRSPSASPVVGHENKIQPASGYVFLSDVEIFPCPSNTTDC